MFGNEFHQPGANLQKVYDKAIHSSCRVISFINLKTPFIYNYVKG